LLLSILLVLVTNTLLLISVLAASAAAPTIRTYVAGGSIGLAALAYAWWLVGDATIRKSIPWQQSEEA
jgi:hypothetical protein